MKDRLLFFDTETTTGWYDVMTITEVVEFGWVLTEGMTVIEQGQSFISSIIPINSYTEKLIEISNDMIAGAPELHDYLGVLAKKTEATILIGHNTQFDLRVIEENLTRRGHTLTPWYEEFSQRAYLDTMHLFGKVMPNAPDRKLKTAMSYAGLDPEIKKHRALPDSQFTKDVFFWLWPRLSDMYQATSVGDFVAAWKGKKRNREQLTLL
ncbi:MAG: 3'-5' exonuclease [Candidatus Dojkabacteria bacterium]|nr:MAG: 3'-5' exonuclease [Candidatus Dojkabacteria bacterium]